MDSSFIKELKYRGFFHQCTDIDSLNKLLNAKSVTAYIGFDPTASSLHVGSLMQIMILRKLQQHGHKPLVLIGGGTGKIGDPSFRSEERKYLSDEDIAYNMSGIKKVISKFIDFDDRQTGAIMLNNADWLDKLNYLEFLRDYGRHFSVNRMLSMDSVKIRLEREQSLSFLEFNYMLLQGYDFVHLHRIHACMLQIGGSDQWGNIISGIELNRRLGNKEIFGLTTPLITKSNGEKMGKSANGAIWLCEEKLSPYEYFQFWRNTDDSDVIRFIKFFTELSEKEISELEKLKGQELNEAKKILAYECTKLCHGEEKARIARETAEKTFEQGTLSDNLPIISVSNDQLNNGIALFELVAKSGFVSSNSEAKKMVKAGAVKINDEKILDEFLKINNDLMQSTDIIKLSVGKKNHCLIKKE